MLWIMITSLVCHPVVDYGPTILSGCSVLGPTGPEGDWFAAEKGFARDESPPIFGHNTWPATAPTLQSPASAAWGLEQRTHQATPVDHVPWRRWYRTGIFPSSRRLVRVLAPAPESDHARVRSSKRKECLTSVSVHVRMRSRSRLKRICNAGTWYDFPSSVWNRVAMSFHGRFSSSFNLRSSCSSSFNSTGPGWDGARLRRFCVNSA
jgi:hypothetical protein